MNYISFKPLARSDFPLLLTWLRGPHIKSWWDQDVEWSVQLVEEKYGSYCEHYKKIDGIKRLMHAYIMLYDAIPIDYIQVYNVRDYSRENTIDFHTLAIPCAAIDFYISDLKYLGKKLGATLLQEFLKQYVWSTYQACLVDPNKENIAAIKTYERAGFVEHKVAEKVIMLLAHKPTPL